eukprot:CAMPEP_0202385410 /NCGR_PEP_ID=MMETSP1127-20130417/60642_1 /ASSEMBLY_ACC=CAM_ASM_000462 /TAXON_ID=3047 /ORGANISM="Dunaliella tertiolecta, Strain CCMP1320" /LENGTH=50 /DNA_ID=CAMNT_0048985559 /DNA_START=239 /DNA_END=391 /DNA_ORIENTATION=+
MASLDQQGCVHGQLAQHCALPCIALAFWVKKAACMDSTVAWSSNGVALGK